MRGRVPRICDEAIGRARRRLSTTQIRVIAGALAVVLLVAVAYTVARPGCSLLPVALPTDTGRASVGTVEQACAVLGRPMPEARALPAGVTRGDIGIDGPGPNDCCRMVHVGYVLGGRGVAVLDIGPGDIPAANKGSVNGTVSGAPAIVTQQKAPSSNGDTVTYVWSRDGLFLVLHVQLDGEISREAADRMADSVR